MRSGGTGLQMVHLSGPYYRYLALRGNAPPRAQNPLVSGR
jgi:hypothetical protein